MMRVSFVRDLHLDCRSLTKREEKLRSYGYWKEVADMMQVQVQLPLHCKCKASTILLHTVLLCAPHTAYSVAVCSTYAFC